MARGSGSRSGEPSAGPIAAATACGVGHRGAAPAEGRQVGLHRGAVELDGPLDGRVADRQAALLVGGADQQHVGRHVVAEQALRTGRRRPRARCRSERVARPTRRSARSVSARPSDGSVTMRAVGVWAVFRTATVRRRSATASVSEAAAPSRSKPRIRSAEAAPARSWPSIGREEMRTSETTGPPFWARPVCSRPEAWRPSRWAAICRIAETVTTPVPPTPGMRTSASAGTRGWGSGRSAGGSGDGRARCSGALAAGVTITNEGQSPLRQVRSLLQEAWWIWVLRPNSVATGCTDRQEDLSPQSPQPSHTRWLIHTFSAGWASLPRLRSRRFSVAHWSSWISTVTPGTAASSDCTSWRSSRWRTVGDRAPAPRRGSARARAW